MITNQALTCQLSKAVQLNCDIADSQHAGDYTMCVYLLKMREYFRWEKGYHYTDKLPSETLGAWLSERESLWDTLSNDEFAAIDVLGLEIDPFDNEAANQVLNPEGLVYSGGIGRQCRPHFFLAELVEIRRHKQYTLYLAGKEQARDLTSPPAMSLGNTIFIRRESLKRMIWEKVEEWNWRKTNTAMTHALSYYDFDTDTHAALEAITDQEQDTVLRHEIGEIEAGMLLDECWHSMLAAMTLPKGEIMIRAIRDHLADCISTLPNMLAKQRDASLHFYFGQFNAMRRELFPGLLDAYKQWHDNGILDPLENKVLQGRQHWLDVGRHITDIFQTSGPQSSPDIVAYIEKNIL
ncbi:MAG TPA: hypothetical protein ENI64_12730 [Gammaproteobacteria bacterium]|nr:hypothetical protein [Gammaproteobacteria bacterium]